MRSRKALVTLRRPICITFTALSCCLPVFSAGLAMASDDSSSPQQPSTGGVHLIGGVGKFDVLTDEIQRAIGIKCATNDHGGNEIVEVAKGSDAANNGLHVGDVISNASLKGNALDLGILDDSGQQLIFHFELKSNHPKFTALLPRPDLTKATAAPPVAPKPDFVLNALRNQAQFTRQQPMLDKQQNLPKLFGQINEAAKYLANYDVELIVDKSMSMKRRDCPGMLSRWEWCASQSQELSRQLAPYVPQGLAIIPFARFYDTYEHQQPQQIANLFYTTELQRGTRLAEPLGDRINQAIFKRARGGKPTIIAIITDGIPAPAYEPQAVVNVLINESQQMRSPQDVSVVFFQIGGHDPFGEQYLMDLDNKLVSWGARFDYVHLVPFERLTQNGLARCLVDAIRALESQRPHR